jgi:hypothetical protein
MESVFYGFETQKIMNIKLKYKAWIGEKHADIAHKLMDNDIEKFALEFAEHLVKDKQYCYLTSFTIDGKEYHIVSDLNEKSDKLTFYKRP